MREIEGCVEGSVPWSALGRVTLLSNGDDRNAALLKKRFSSARSLLMSELALPGVLTLDPEQVVAAALSLVEARPR